MPATTIVWFAFMGFNLISILVLTFFTVAGRHKLGLIVSAASGLTNVALDIVFMGPMGWGMHGAALVTVLSWIVAAAAGAVYFRRADAGLRLILTRPDRAALKGACTSGFSEMVSNLSFGGDALLFQHGLFGAPRRGRRGGSDGGLLLNLRL